MTSIASGFTGEGAPMKAHSGLLHLGIPLAYSPPVVEHDETRAAIGAPCTSTRLAMLEVAGQEGGFEDRRPS
jgi:hypothetical protein